jgi:hypothetical protein
VGKGSWPFYLMGSILSGVAWLGSMGWAKFKQYALTTALFIPLFLAMIVSLAVDVPRQIVGLEDRRQAYLVSPARRAKLGKRSIRKLSGRSWI